MNISVSDLASLSEKKEERKRSKHLDRKENEYQSHNGKGAMSLVYT